MKRISWIVVVLAGVMLAAGLVAAPAFAIDSWNVTVEVNDPSAGTVTGAGQYEGGVEVTLEATPEEDYYFVNWTDENGGEIKDEHGDVVGATYKFTVEDNRTLTANFKLKTPITITAVSGTWTYDGKEHTNGSVTVTSGELEIGDDLSASTIGSQTDVGSSKNVVDAGYKVENGKLEDMSYKYNITTEAGTLTVTKAPLTITTGSATKAYDGKTGKVTVKANVGDTVTIPGPPTRKGYTFKYWQGSCYKPGDSYKVVGDHSFSAVWEKVSEPKTPTRQSTSSPLPQTGDPTGAASALLALGPALVTAGLALRRRDR